MVATLHLIYNLNRDILVTAPSPGPIVVTQASNLVFNLLLVIAVPQFEFSCGFSHILTLALVASSQVNYKFTVAIQFLLYPVNLLGVCASKFPPLL